MCVAGQVVVASEADWLCVCVCVCVCVCAEHAVCENEMLCVVVWLQCVVITIYLDELQAGCLDGGCQVSTLRVDFAHG